MSKTSLLVIIGLCTNNSTAVLSWLSSPVRETLGMNTSHTQRCDKLTETLNWSCLPVAQRWTDCQTTWIIWVARSQSNRMAVGSLRQTELSAIMFKTSNKGMNELGFIPLVELYIGNQQGINEIFPESCGGFAKWTLIFDPTITSSKCQKRQIISAGEGTLVWISFRQSCTILKHHEGDFRPRTTSLW